MSFARYPAYKDSGVAWLGEVPGHWGFDRQDSGNDQRADGMKKILNSNMEALKAKVTPQKLDIPKIRHPHPEDYSTGIADLALLGGTESKLKTAPRRRQ